MNTHHTHHTRLPLSFTLPSLSVYILEEEEQCTKTMVPTTTNSRGGTTPETTKALAASIRTAVSSAFNSLLPLPPPPPHCISLIIMLLHRRKGQLAINSSPTDLQELLLLNRRCGLTLQTLMCLARLPKLLSPIPKYVPPSLLPPPLQ